MTIDLERKRTRENDAKIKANFLALLREKPFKKIRIEEITEKSEISRQTFYHYYSSKNDLLVALLDDVFEEIYDELMPITAENKNGLKAMRTLFTYCDKHADLLRCVIRADKDELIYNRVRSYATRIAGNIIRVNNVQIKNPLHTTFLAEQIAGSVFHQVKFWLEQEGKITVDEVIELSRLSTHFEKTFFSKDKK